MSATKNIKKLTLISIVMVFISIVLIQPFTIQKASALGNGYMSECGTSFMTEWDWQTAVKTVAPDFDIATSSYIIMQLKSNRDSWNANPIPYNTDFNAYVLVLAPTGTKLMLNLSDWSTYTNVMRISVDGNSQILRPINIISQPTGHGWTGTHIKTTVTATSSWNNPWPYPFISSKSVPTASDYWACYSTSRNMEYAPSWTYDTYTRFETSNDNTPEVPCATLDIACHISKIYNKTIDTMKDVTTTIIDFIANAFIPDMGIIDQDLQDITTEWNDQMGFVTPLIVFIPDTLNSLTTTVNDGSCTTSNCSKTFGNFFGQPFTINFAVASTVSTSLFNWFRALLIFSTLFALAVMARRKYLNMLGHGKASE